MNEVTLTGNMGSDFELRYTQTGKAVANGRMATNESYTNSNNERVQRTEWHSLVIWGGLAETTADVLKKGDPVMVIGRHSTRKWEDQNGNTRYSQEVVVQSIGKRIVPPRKTEEE